MTNSPKLVTDLPLAPAAWELALPHGIIARAGEYEPGKFMLGLHRADGGHSFVFLGEKLQKPDDSWIAAALRTLG